MTKSDSGFIRSARKAIIESMHSDRWPGVLGVTLLVSVLVIIGFRVHSSAEAAQSAPFVLTGRLKDEQDQPVVAAAVVLQASEEVASTESLEDGSWSLLLAGLPPAESSLLIERPHFHSVRMTLGQPAIESLESDGSFDLGELVLERRITPGFWAAGVIFIAVLALIAFEKLHSTTAALAGLSAVLFVNFLGAAINSDWFIFTFERALIYINWEVIFLVMAMMIIIAMIEHTGIFQWTAFQAYRLSRGRVWLLTLIMMLITAVASALLDNFTTMLLMVPISLQIGLALGIDPLALIIPEVLASNVGGISTLIGTPTNILIGAHAGIGFTGFLLNQTIGVIAALMLMAGFVLYHYRDEWRRHGTQISDALYERLRENATLTDPASLWKAGLVFMVVLIGFVLGESYHIAPAVPALIGASVLLIWLRPDVQTSIKAVDWTTLVFFMALFVVVGAIQEVGLISVIAEAMGRLIGDSLALGIFVIVFGVGTLSVAIANIPLAASMLPVVDFLTGTVPGAGSQVLYYALSMGAAMGGNGFLIGGEANLVTAGITQQAGSPISFARFMRVGLPVTYLTLTAGFLWLVLRFLVLN
jgi:Na+/H+ antiporter NhaD/arsenite permease-like protein